MAEVRNTAASEITLYPMSAGAFQAFKGAMTVNEGTSAAPSIATTSTAAPLLERRLLKAHTGIQDKRNRVQAILENRFRAESPSILPTKSHPRSATQPDPDDADQVDIWKKLEYEENERLACAFDKSILVGRCFRVWLTGARWAQVRILLC